MPVLSMLMAVATAESILAKGQTAAETAAGNFFRRRVTSAIKAKVPSEPTNNRVRS